MSYDLRVWGRQFADLSGCFPERAGWTRRGGFWTLERSSWQIVAGEMQRAEPEDVPPEAAEALPGLAVLVALSLEPVGAPRSAHAALHAAARAVAAELAGLVEDPQEGTVTLPRGVKRYVPPARAERLDVLELSWYHLTSPLREDGGAMRLLQTLRASLPEAVPRRYGLYEPPQHRTDETGLEHLATFLADHLEASAVCYPTRPCVGFSLADCGGKPAPRLGFRAHRFALQFEAAALRQPGWERALRQLWRDVSRFFQPFYADARIVRGFAWSGATLLADRETEVHPIRSWFWRGIPPTPGLAMVLGPPYTELWRPELTARDGDLVFVEHPHWSDGQRLPLTVPPEIAQPWEPAWVNLGHGTTIRWCDAYPPRWPFGPAPE